MSDGPPFLGVDALPEVDAGEPNGPLCTAGETDCDGRVLRTCNEDGSAYSNVDCPFTCEAGQGSSYCSLASNIPVNAQLTCDRNRARPLVLTADARIESASSSLPARICQGPCGPPDVLVEAAGSFGDNGAVWFCLSELAIPMGVTLSGGDNLNRPVLFFVIGTATIDGTLNVAGDDATDSNPGGGGPGGGDGGDSSFGDRGSPGEGLCPGQGGGRAGSGGSRIGGGGGGGGNGAAGGEGGSGQPSSGDNAPGGEAGDACGIVSVEPLVGGSGGGGGGDSTTCNDNCGRPGGGGGGAVQLAATEILITGEILASGGDGFSNTAARDLGAGAGGGGAGGSILLEASRIEARAGSLRIEGGDGGASGAGDGGAGASGIEVATPGASAQGNGQGGAGGGGGGGVVRLNAATPADCADRSNPTFACTTGALKQSVSGEQPAMGN